MANPFIISIEEGLPLFGVVAPVATATVTELPGTGVFPASLNPVHSIRSDQAWGVRVQWSTGGALGPLLSGNWNVTVYLDRMAGGAHTPVVQSKPVQSTDPAHYVVDIPFAAGAVPAGAYRMAVTITMTGPTGVPAPIGGVGDGPLLQFYDAA